MDEMHAWATLSDGHRELVLSEAKKHLRWCANWGDQVRPWGHVIEGRCVRGLAEDVNTHLLDRLDATLVRVMSGLKRAGIQRPLVPLYVAVWMAATEIEDDEIPVQVDLAIALAMIRVQGTARLVHVYNQSPGDADLALELQRRGLIRR